MESTDIPTNAQITEFWEQHGLHHNKPTGGFFWDEGDNLVFDMHKGETGITLDILFRYAVSRYRKTHDDKASRQVLMKWVNMLIRVPVYADHPALTLFWTLKEA